jgi:uncharacterized protein (TIGR03435 family)
MKEATDTAGGSGIRGQCGQLTGIHTVMANLSQVLSRQMGRTVLDRSGLTAKYDFELKYTPDAGPCTTPEGGTAAAADNPSIFEALQEQLGLKLETTKAPVEIVVLDHVEKREGN